MRETVNGRGERAIAQYIVDWLAVGVSGNAIAQYLERQRRRHPKGLKWTSARVHELAGKYPDLEPTSIGTAGPCILASFEPGESDDTERPPLTAVQSRAIRKWKGLA